MTYQNKFVYYLMDIKEVTQEMVDRSQSNGIGNCRVSKTDLSGNKYVILKFKLCNIPLSIAQEHADDVISHSDLLLELGGSIWQL